MRTKKSNGIILLSFFVLLYCNVLRAFLGSWITIVSDIYLVVLLGIIFVQEYKKPQNVFFWLLPVLIVLAALSILNPNINNKLYALIEFRKTYFQFMWFFVGFFVVKKKHVDLDKCLFGYELMAIPLLLYGIKQYLFPTSFDLLFYSLQDADVYTYVFKGGLRSISVFSGPFHFGLFSDLTLIIALFSLLYDKKHKFFHLITAIFAFVSILCSLTRTNLICSLMALFCFAWKTIDIYTRKKSRQVLHGCLIGLVVCVPLFLLLSNSNFQLIQSILHFSSDTRFLGRVETWKMSMALIDMNPWLGYGIGAAGDTMSAFGVSEVYTVSHNMFIKSWFETGIFGLIIFLILFVRIGFDLTESKGSLLRDALLMFFVVIFINALVGSTMGVFPIISIFLFLIGIFYQRFNKPRMAYSQKKKGDNLYVQNC